MAIRNLDAFFQPRSIAVIGPEHIGSAAFGLFFANLARSGFKGKITLVDVAAPEGWTGGVAASIEDLALPIDLAVVLSGPETAGEIVNRLGVLGIKAALFPARGFTEWPFAVARQVLQIAREHGLRLIGPGSLGVVAPHVGLDLGFAGRAAKKGDLALVSRSSAVINSTLAWAERHGVGFSAVVSLGQKVDVDIGDLLDHFCADYRTRAVLVHLESIWSPSKFLSAARACARTKPVIVIRSGTSRDKRMIGQTHSTRLASTDWVYDAAFRSEEHTSELQSH